MCWVTTIENGECCESVTRNNQRHPFRFYCCFSWQLQSRAENAIHAAALLYTISRTWMHFKTIPNENCFGGSVGLGLGHATRSIPVVRELIKQNARVLIAGDGSSLSLLKQEFPIWNFMNCLLCHSLPPSRKHGNTIAKQFAFCKKWFNMNLKLWLKL